MDSFNDYRQLLALEDAGNFRKAADRLGISHSALSQTVSKMEKRLGVSLFVRTKLATVPTSYGQRLMDAARLAIGEISGAEREISLMRNLEAGRLVIGADPNVSETLLAPALTQLMRQYPKLHFSVQAQNWVTMVDELRARRIDLYLGLAPDRRESDFVYADLLFPPPLVTCRASHPILTTPDRDGSDWTDYPIIGGEAPDWFLSAIQQQYPERFRSIDALRSTFMIAQDLGLVRQMLLATDALAMMPLPVIEQDVRQGQLVVLPPGNAPFPETIPGVIASLAGRPLPPAAAKLSRLVQETLALDDRPG